MKVVILCGGKGTRIRDVSTELPKPMINIGDYPIVKHITDIYSAYGHYEFILCLGYKAWAFKEYYLNYRAETSDVVIDFSQGGEVEYVDPSEKPPWRITLAQTGQEAMTGCRIKRVQKYVGDETFMLTYGDGVSDIDVSKLAAFHRSHGKLITITSVYPRSRFGTLVVKGTDVVSFEEKPQSKGGLINGGFFVCEPGVFEYLTDDESCTFEGAPLQQLARDGQAATYVHEGFWMPLDTHREYLLLNKLWEEGRAPWCKKRTPDENAS